MKNIALFGFMGSGKTTVGRQLAQVLKWRFLDTDALIEEESGLSIPEIFQKWGEEHFRQLESTVLQEVAQLTEVVLATGGGLPTQEENWPCLEKNFITAFLKVSFPFLYQRIKNDTGRPLVQQYPTLDRLEELYRQRLPFYERANITIEADNLTPEQVVKVLIRAIRGSAPKGQGGLS